DELGDLANADARRGYRSDDRRRDPRCARRNPRPCRRRRPLCGAGNRRKFRRHEPGAPAPGRLCRAQGKNGGRAARLAAGDSPSIRRPSMSDAKERIDALVKSNDVVLFMKGTALFPQCGFSSRAVAILDHLNATFETVDVLQDQEIRQGIKEYSDWPT